MRMKKKIIIFGYGYDGAGLYRRIKKENVYEVIGFADNSVYKIGNMAGGGIIRSMEDLIQLKNDIDFSVIIAARKWYDIGVELERYAIKIEGIYQNGNIGDYNRMCFEKLDLESEIKLYAGDIYDSIHMSDPNLFGLSICKADKKHILHDITCRYPLPDNCISSYEAEDVLEHIAPELLVDTINEVYRILKQGAVFRICLPDYYSPYLKEISMKNSLQIKSQAEISDL